MKFPQPILSLIFAGFALFLDVACGGCRQRTTNATNTSKENAYADEPEDQIRASPSSSKVVKSYGSWEGGSAYLFALDGHGANGSRMMMNIRWTNLPQLHLHDPANRFPGAWVREVISTEEEARPGDDGLVRGLAWGNRPAAFCIARVDDYSNHTGTALEVRRKGVWNREFLGGNRSDMSCYGLDSCLVAGVPYVAFVSGHNGHPFSEIEHKGLTLRSLQADGWHTEFESQDDYGIKVAIAAVGGQPVVVTSRGQFSDGHPFPLHWFERRADGHWLGPIALPGAADAVDAISIADIGGKAAVLVAMINPRNISYYERNENGWIRTQIDGTLCGNCRLLSWNGEPAFALGGSKYGGDGEVYWFNREDAQWRRHLIEAGHPDSSYVLDGAIVNGKPSIVYSQRMSGRVRYRQLSGDTWSDAIIDDTAGTRSFEYSLFDLKGYAAIFSRCIGNQLPRHLVYLEEPHSKK